MDTQPKKYALELWVEIETSPGMYSTPNEDSYSIDFAIDIINCAYPGCTGMYLDVAGHMLAFYGKKTNPRAGLLHDQAVVASKAIINISTWMGYFARWRVQCVSISEASEILYIYIYIMYMHIHNNLCHLRQLYMSHVHQMNPKHSGCSQ